jgi:hypothetical protein
VEFRLVILPESDSRHGLVAVAQREALRRLLLHMGEDENYLSSTDEPSSR